MNVFALEPYYGGSHRAFLDSLADRSRHHWSLVTLPARHWKWRMRSAPTAILRSVAETRDRVGIPDVIVASTMLDLPVFLGLASRDVRLRDFVSDVPVVAYFHENQWAYPAAPGTPVDHHYGYTNLLSAAIASECWFNSRFNQDSFLRLSRSFLERMPDSRQAIDLDAIARRCRVIPPGFEPPTELATKSARRTDEHSAMRIGWVGRFEHDKRPDRFLELLESLAADSMRFELVLLGQRGRSCESLDEIRSRFGERIRFDGFAESREEYWSRLSEIDVVVSTAEHEFFGIAICESIWSGAIPVTPNGLSYVEYVPDRLRYDSPDQARQIIQGLGASDLQDLSSLRDQCCRRIEGYRVEKTVETIDGELERIAAE